MVNSKTMEITGEQKKTIEELRRRIIHIVTPKMLEDVSLFYRFAKARDFNLVEAEGMLRKHIAWRKEMQIDTVLTDYEPPEVLFKYVPTNFVCYDKEGSIVRLQDSGRVDARSLWNLIKKAEFGKYIAYIIEKDRDMLIKKGRNLEKPIYLALYDFEDLTYSNAVSIKTLQYLPYLMKMFVDNFPETLKLLIVINVPFYFSWIYSAVKPVIPKTVVEKFGVYGTEGWKEALLKMIDAADLPAYLGGTRTDPDGNPLCESFIIRARPIPKSYFSSKESEKLSLSSDAYKLIVKPFSKEEIIIEIKDDNSLLEWEFETKNGDIEFSLLFKEKSSKNIEPVEIMPKKRVNARDESEKGHFKCEQGGSCIMVFDNSNSWFYSKEIYYRAEIKNPKNDEIDSLA